MSDKQEPILIVIEGLIDAFIDAYEPAPSEWEADEIYPLGRLREFFGAYAPNPGMIDPISTYINELREQGFIMQVVSSGYPAIVVNRRKG